MLFLLLLPDCSAAVASLLGCSSQHSGCSPLPPPGCPHRPSRVLQPGHGQVITSKYANLVEPVFFLKSKREESFSFRLSFLNQCTPDLQENRINSKYCVEVFLNFRKGRKIPPSNSFSAERTVCFDPSQAAAADFSQL